MNFKTFLKYQLLLWISIFFLGSDSISYAYDFYPNFILLSDYHISINIGDSYYLTAVTSNGKQPTFKSSNSSIVQVNSYGKIIAKKSGNATITVKSSGFEAECLVTVSKTIITLNKASISMDCSRRFLLKATTSNNSKVTFKIDKKSIAEIDSKGYITSKKPGKAIVTISADDSCIKFTVNVKKPTITLNKSRITLKVGQRYKLLASVSSGKAASFKSSRKTIATIDNSGIIRALKSGTTIITASVDGTTKDCYVIVE